MLMVNGIMQTGMPLDITHVDAGDILQSDSYYLELLPYFHKAGRLDIDPPGGRRGVLIGLAGGMFPRVMEFHRIDWTAVEIDVKVAQLARAYFGYRGEIRYPDGRRVEVDVDRFPNRQYPDDAKHLAPETGPDEPPPPPYLGRAVIQDGRGFLQGLARRRERVNFIVLDAYNSDAIPFHLITREFFELVRGRLVEDGILAINYIGRPTGDFVTDSLFRTLGDVFGPEMLRAYRTRDDTAAAQVIIVFAFRRPMELCEALWRTHEGRIGADPLSYELSRRTVETRRPGGMVITDDRNPIDLARAETALEWRRETAKLMAPHSPAPREE